MLVDEETLLAKAVRLESGEVIDADLVISNVDLPMSYNQLLSKEPRYDEKSRKLAGWSPLSTICIVQ